MTDRPADSAARLQRTSIVARVLSLIALFALLLVVYIFAIRPSQLRWGATPEELARVMPGDNLISTPTFFATRAITINARPGDIWPWLAQIGYNRAGFYGYDVIENLGAKQGIRSADRIIPELQHPATGDLICMSPVSCLQFGAILPNEFLIWTGRESPPLGAFTWALYPLDANHTRLVSRIRIRYHWTDRTFVLALFTEFADHVAVPKILAGVKDRVERRQPEPLTAQLVNIAVWLLAFLEFVASMFFLFRWRYWWQAWTLALASGALLFFSLYARQPAWLSGTLALALAATIFLCRANSRRHRFHLGFA